MRFAFRALILIVVSVFPAVPLLAHHSFSAQYDSTKVVNLTGKVTNWEFEMGGPNTLMRLGWTRNSLKIDDTIKVEGTLARDGSKLANARTVVLTSTGKKLFAGSSEGTTP